MMLGLFSYACYPFVYHLWLKCSYLLPISLLSCLFLLSCRVFFFLYIFWMYVHFQIHEPAGCGVLSCLLNQFSPNPSCWFSGLYQPSLEGGGIGSRPRQRVTSSHDSQLNFMSFSSISVSQCFLPSVSFQSSETVVLTILSSLCIVS